MQKLRGYGWIPDLPDHRYTAQQVPSELPPVLGLRDRTGKGTASLRPESNGAFVKQPSRFVGPNQLSISSIPGTLG